MTFPQGCVLSVAAQNVLLQPAEGLLHPAERQRQVHADVVGSVEGATVLPGHTVVPTLADQRFDVRRVQQPFPIAPR